MPSEDGLFVWLNWLVAAAIALAIMFLHGRWLTPNVYTVPLGRCDVDGHVDVGIVAMRGETGPALAEQRCVSRGISKVLPLPVEQPWWEDAPETPGRGMACRAQAERRRSGRTRRIRFAKTGVQ
jgi:hypothetical protein